MNSDHSWKAVSYARTSKGNIEPFSSNENQQLQIRQYCAAQPNLTLVAEYEDNGFSGVQFNRPGLNELIDFIRAEKANCIVFRDLSRLGRNYIEVGKWLNHILPFLRVRVISINDAYDSQYGDPDVDEFTNAFKSLIDDYYAQDVSRKIRSQLQVKRHNGDFIGAFAPYGYKKSIANKNQLVVDMDAAPIIQDIFQWKIAGLNNQGIADRLNERKMRLEN